MKAHNSLVFGAILSAAACSGGSDSADPLLPTVQISGANAVEVTKATLTAAFGLADTLAIVIELLPTLENGAAEGPQGGQVLRTFEDRDGDGKLSTGDACTLTFAAYADGAHVLNGSVRIDDVDLAGPLVETQSSILEARLECVGLAVVRGSRSESLLGEVRIRREQRPTVRLLGVGIDGPFGIGGKSLLAGTVIERNDFPLVYARSWSAAGGVEGTGVAGSLRFETDVAFAGSMFQPYPWSGELDVRGRNSRVTIKAVDFTADLAVEVDADGDGEVDEVIETTWAEL